MEYANLVIIRLGDWELMRYIITNFLCILLPNIPFVLYITEMILGFHLKVLSFFQGEDFGEVIYEKSENHFVKVIY